MFDDEGFEDYESLINLPVDPGHPDSSKVVGPPSELFKMESTKERAKTQSRRHAAKISYDFVYGSNNRRRKTNYSTSSSSIGSNVEHPQPSIGAQKNFKTKRLSSRLPSATTLPNNSNNITKTQESTTSSQSRNKRKPARTNSHQTYSNLPKPKIARYHSNQEGVSNSYIDDEDLDFDDCDDIDEDDDIDLSFDLDPYPTDSDKYRWSGSSRPMPSRGAPHHSSSSGISRKSDIQISPGNEDRRLMHNAQERKRRGIIKKLKKELEGILPDRLKRSVLGEAFKADQSLSNPDISRCLEAYTKEISEAFSEAEVLKEKWKRLKNALDNIEGGSNNCSSFFNSNF